MNGIDGINGLNGKDGLNARDGKDGLDLVNLMIDQGGNLVATLSDGNTKSVGRVVVSPEEIKAMILEAMPEVKDGKDGVGYDDLVETLEEDGRTILRRYMKGDQVVKEYRHKFPVILDRGVFDRAKSYEHGDAVSYEGSLWVSQVDNNSAIPGTNSQWRLAVKRGRDAKAVVIGPKKEAVKVKVDD